MTRLNLLLVLFLIGATIGLFHQYWHRSVQLTGGDGHPARMPASGFDGLEGEMANESKITVEPLPAGAVVHRAEEVVQSALTPVVRNVESGFDVGEPGGQDATVSGSLPDGVSPSLPANNEPGPDRRVLHITNIGDKIIITDETNKVISSYAAFHSEVDSVDAALIVAAPDHVDAGQAVGYREVYPGCPEALPEGSGEQYARQLRENYGCRYRRSCTAPTDEQGGGCTWYFAGKV